MQIAPVFGLCSSIQASGRLLLTARLAKFMQTACLIAVTASMVKHLWARKYAKKPLEFLKHSAAFAPVTPSRGLGPGTATDLLSRLLREAGL